jgi:hypothetical protein
MGEPLGPSLYQINTRVWLTELSRALGRPATLDDMPDAELDRLAGMGFGLMLDFVPDHTGLDHPWVEDHPEYYVPGTELDLARAPHNYTWAKRQARRPASGLRPRSVLRRLAGHPSTQLRQRNRIGHRLFSQIRVNSVSLREAPMR